MPRSDEEEERRVIYQRKHEQVQRLKMFLEMRDNYHDDRLESLIETEHDVMRIIDYCIDEGYDAVDLRNMIFPCCGSISHFGFSVCFLITPFSKKRNCFQHADCNNRDTVNKSVWSKSLPYLSDLLSMVSLLSPRTRPNQQL